MHSQLRVERENSQELERHPRGTRGRSYPQGIAQSMFTSTAVNSLRPFSRCPSVSSDVRRLAARRRLITIPWLLSVYAGRVDIINGKPSYSEAGKKAEGEVTGVANSPAVQKGSYVMMITALSYILLQAPAQYLQSQGDSKSEVAEGEKTFALVGLFVTLGLFFGYLCVCGVCRAACGPRWSTVQRACVLCLRVV